MCERGSLSDYDSFVLPIACTGGASPFPELAQKLRLHAFGVIAHAQFERIHALGNSKLHFV